MSTIQEGLTSPKPAGVSQRGGRQTPPPAAPTPRPVTDILAAAKTRAEARRQRARQTPDTSSVQLIVALLETRDFLQADYGELDRNRALYPDAARQIAEIKRELDQVKADLDFYLNPKREENEDETTFEGRHHKLVLSVEEANRVVALRSAARSWTEAIRTTTNPDANTITAFLEDAERNISPFVLDVPEKSPLQVTTWKRRHLGSVMPQDEIVSEVVKTFGEMVKTFVDKKEQEADDVVQLLDYAGYYLPEADDTDEGEESLASIRKSGNSANLTRFLGDGEGTYSIVGYRFGESLVLERRSDRIYPYKASGPRIGQAAFLFRDKDTRALKVVERNRLRALEINGTDVSKIWNHQIREALQFQLQREAENAEKREASREIRDVTGIENPITSYELAILGKSGTCPMSYRLKRDDWFVEVTYRLVSDGTNVFVSDFTPGALDKADPNKTWLRREVKKGEPSLLDSNNPFPISELRRFREWTEASRANGHFEAEWQTEREAKRLGATAVNHSNLNNLVSVESGVDGMYAFTAQSRRKGGTGNVYWVSGGFIVERKGSKVNLVWASAGVQKEAGRIGKDSAEVADLPSTFRDVFRSLYLGVNGLRGKDAWKQAPNHLQRVVEGDTQEETEE